MRKSILIFVFVVPAMLLIAGVAYARTIDCTGGECEGTNGPDMMNGSPRGDKMLAMTAGTP